MSGYVFAPLAKSDLEQILSYYRDELHNCVAAERLRRRFLRTLRLLAKEPEMGHWRSDLADEPLRFWPMDRYLIIYRSQNRPIEILRLLHGARDVKAVLDD